jgi:hypothetical protein
MCVYKTHKRALTRTVDVSVVLNAGTTLLFLLFPPPSICFLALSSPKLESTTLIYLGGLLQAFTKWEGGVSNHRSRHPIKKIGARFFHYTVTHIKEDGNT